MAFAGFMAGLLGIGGALIFNPVLLQLGVQPQVRPQCFHLPTSGLPCGMDEAACLFEVVLLL